MALGTSMEAAIEKYSAKFGLGSPAIPKMELFVTLYDCHKELYLRCCRGPWSVRGYKFSFCIDHHVNFPCLQKKLCHYFFDSLWRFLISDIFFWKVDKLELLEVLRSFYISRHDFSQIFRTSFNIICKNNFRHERWESDEDWFWPFEPISKLKTTYKYWASIKFGTASMKLKQKRHRSNDDS